jgi:hypothetical protein
MEQEDPHGAGRAISRTNKRETKGVKTRLNLNYGQFGL